MTELVWGLMCESATVEKGKLTMSGEIGADHFPSFPF
jgi:hypothetical protein